MGNFNRDRGGNRGSYRGGKRSGGDRLEMFKAVCADCGRSCEVPFRPTASKPVYCRECFNSHSDRTTNSDREMFSVTCDSCGKRCEVPFKPTGNKPVYCSNCFGHKGDSRDDFGNRNDRPRKEERRERPTTTDVESQAINAQMQEQLKIINIKLDRLLRALELRGKIEETEPIKEAKTTSVESKTPIEKPLKKTAKKTVKKPAAKTITKEKSKKKTTVSKK